MDKCSIKDCHNKRLARGWCRKHYQRWYKHGDPLTTLLPRKGVCSVGHCDESHYAHGFCMIHHAAKKRGHDPYTYFRKRKNPPRGEFRECTVEGDICYIPLPGTTLRAMVDAEDFDLVQDFNWTLIGKTGNNYVSTNRSTGKRDNKSALIYRALYLHRHIMGQYESIDGFDIDHLSHDTLDNRKQNLRVCTRSVNSMNRLSPNRNSSWGFKGVSYDKRQDSWRAQFKGGINGRYIGTYPTKEEAAMARDIACMETFGETMLTHSLNFPDKFLEYQKIISSSQPRT